MKEHNSFFIKNISLFFITKKGSKWLHVCVCVCVCVCERERKRERKRERERERERDTHTRTRVQTKLRCILTKLSAACVESNHSSLICKAPTKTPPHLSVIVGAYKNVNIATIWFGLVWFDFVAYQPLYVI